MAARRPWDVTLSTRDIARFWSSVKMGRASECWPCTSLISDQGRPRFYAQRRFFQASHVAYTLMVGPFEAETLDHTCLNVLCVNPRHLDPCSGVENSRRARRDGLGGKVGAWQSSKAECKRGHPLSGENLLRQHIKNDPPGTKRGRRCRTCNEESNRKARKRYRESHL